MKMLSEIIARAYCPAASPVGPDRFFAVGCHLVGAAWLAADPSDVAKIAAQARTLERTGHTPWEPDQDIDGVFNDLFSPFREESDGALTVWIPIPIEESLTSSFLVKDWRVVALAWWATRRLDAKPDQRVVVMVFDASGRRMVADFKASDLYAAMDIAINRPTASVQRPGAACSTCGKADRCEGLKTFMDDLGPILKGKVATDPDLIGLRLFNERSAISIRMERLEGQRTLIDTEITKLAKDGKLKMGPDDTLEIPARSSTTWDFHQVRQTLMSAGLWDDSFGTIRATELQAAMSKFPADVQKQLEKAKTVKTNQPSISEAIRHGRYATKPAVFGAVTLRRKDSLGKS